MNFNYSNEKRQRIKGKRIGIFLSLLQERYRMEKRERDFVVVIKCLLEFQMQRRRRWKVGSKGRNFASQREKEIRDKGKKKTKKRKKSTRTRGAFKRFMNRKSGNGKDIEKRRSMSTWKMNELK